MPFLHVFATVRSWPQFHTAISKRGLKPRVSSFFAGNRVIDDDDDGAEEVSKEEKDPPCRILGGMVSWMVCNVCLIEDYE